MVVGRTSNYAEGFKSFTADDELMLANLKQALNYSADNLSIPDANLNIPINSVNQNPVTTQYNGNINPIKSNLNSKTKLDDNSKSNSVALIQSGTSTKTTLPSGTTIPSKTTIPIIPTNTYAIPTMQNMETTNTYGIPTMQNMETTNTYGIPTMQNMETTNTKVSKSQFRDIKSLVDEEDQDEDENEETILDEEEHENVFEEEMEERRNKTRRQSHMEGFQGSVEIESRNLKNVLLALLLSFIGYLVVYASMNNFIPITDISPQLKKFKNLVYGGLFFIIAYICLEVF
jgi:hypothetical protein